MIRTQLHGHHAHGINAYLAANPQLEAIGGMGIWAKEAWHTRINTLSQLATRAW